MAKAIFTVFFKIIVAIVNVILAPINLLNPEKDQQLTN